MKKKKEIDKSASGIAYELLEVRSQINELKRVDRVLSEELRTRIRSGETQDTYTLRKDLQLAIADQGVAYAWAQENSCLKVDVPSVDKFLKGGRMAVPPGFGLREVEKLIEVKEGDIAKEEFVIEG